jgi:AcrR family transcriptional regulator
VLHRHFADFDDFLAALIADRARQLQSGSAELEARAGTGSVAGNLAAALTEVFGSVALEILRLVIFRDDLRTRLRRESGSGLAILGEAAAMLAAYLRAEREIGRIAADADVDFLALSLIGTGHLVFAGRHGEPPPPEDVLDVVTKVLRGA